MLIYLRLFSCLFLSLSLLLSGYSPKAETAETSPSGRDPLSKHWVLRTLDGAAVPPSLKVSDAASRLFESTGASTRRRLTGQSYSGAFTHTLGSRLRALAQVITTLMKSDDAALNVELHYLTAVEQSTYYRIAGSTLSLFDKEGATPRVTFQEAR